MAIILGHKEYNVMIEKLYKRQRGLCSYCNEQIAQDDIKEQDTHTHHMRPRSLKSYGNRRLLHAHCHRELHASLSRKDMGKLSEEDVDYIGKKEQ